MNRIETSKLKEHHKNGFYFTDIEGEKYAEVKRSIEQHGIRDPIKVHHTFTAKGETEYTVISGHQRLRIARDIGMDYVPVDVIPEISDDNAEYLLIAENVERRGQAETDPIKKSRIATFLKEYWGVRTGRGGDRKSTDIMSIDKTTEDISEAIGESEKSTQRLMKLNDLIPQLQSLVSSGKLGATSAEQLAYLTPEVQSALYETLGDEITTTTVAEQTRLRREIEAETTKQQDEINILRRELKEAEKKGENIEDTTSKINALENDKAELTLKLLETRREEEEKLTELRRKADEEKAKLETDKKRYADEVKEKEGEIKKYEEHVTELLGKLDSVGKEIDDQGLSDRSIHLMKHQTNFVDQALSLSEQVAILFIDVPQDLPQASKEAYKVSMERLNKLTNEALESLAPQNKTIIKGEIINE